MRTPPVVRTAPTRIWLQVSDDVNDMREPFPALIHDGITWCQDSCIACEVEYVRADLVRAAIHRKLKRGATENNRRVSSHERPAA